MSERADVLAKRVERTGRGRVAPDHVDELTGADRPARPCQQNGEQSGLLPGPGLQLDIAAPDPQRAEDLQADVIATDRLISGPSTRVLQAHLRRPVTAQLLGGVRPPGWAPGLTPNAPTVRHP